MGALRRPRGVWCCGERKFSIDPTVSEKFAKKCIILEAANLKTKSGGQESMVP